MLYREANESDLPGICVLGDEVTAIHYRAFPDVFAAPGKADRGASHWMKSIGKETSTIFVAEEAETLLGFVSVSIITEPDSLLQPMCFGRVGSVGVTEARRGE